MAAGGDVVFEIAKLFGIAGTSHVDIHHLRINRSPSVLLETERDLFPSMPVVVDTSSCSIERSVFHETTQCCILILFMSSNYFVIRIQEEGADPVVKQLQWFQDRPNTVMDMVLGSNGEWLACATLDGSIHLVPIAPLLMGRPPSIQYGSMDDIEILKPVKRYAPPTCMVWWESLDHINYIITGSEKGELVLFDLISKSEKQIAIFGECIDSLQILRDKNEATFIVICLRGFHWWALQLDELVRGGGSPSMRRTGGEPGPIRFDYPSVRSIANKTQDDSQQFTPFKLKFGDLYRLTVLKWKLNENRLGVHNLQTHVMEIYTSDLHMMCSLYAYNIPPFTTDVIVVQRLLFVLCHNDEEEEFSLKVLSERRSKTGSEPPSQLGQDKMERTILMTQTFSTDNIIKGFYPIGSNWNEELVEEFNMPVTQLDGCVLVTHKGVYHLRQKCSAESLFINHALTPSGLVAANDIAILYDLDVHELYKIVAEKKLEEGHYQEALEVYLHSMCDAKDVIEGLLRKQCYEETLTYIDHVLEDYSKRARSDRKWLYKVLLYCYIHQVLVCRGDLEKMKNLERMRQRLIDDFHLETEIVLKTFLSYGLVDEMMEYAKAKGLVGDALSLVLNSGCLATANHLSSSLTTSQYVSILSSVAKGLYLQMMPTKKLIKVLRLKPSIILGLEGHLREVLPTLNLDLLLELAELLDPSHSTIKPLLHKGLAQPRQRSGSTGSLMSVVSNLSTVSEEPTVQAEVLLELFLCVLVYVKYRRKQDPFQLQNQKSSISVSHGPCVLSCGVDHAGLVGKESGELFTWGGRSYGKLGHEDMEFSGSQCTPVQVNILSSLGVQVTSVSCGAQHTIILSHQGVYSWGNNQYGQLGHGDTLSRYQPVLVSSLVGKNIMQITSGHGHCLAIAEDTKVWGWGHNEHGQLGLGHRHEDKTTPTHVTLLDPHNVVMVSGGNRHSAVVSLDGKVLTFGSSSNGQLGHKDHVTCTEPTIVQSLTSYTVHLISCGAHHTMAAAKNGLIFVFGKNFFGEDHVPKTFFQFKSSRYGDSSPLSSGDFLVPMALPETDITGEVIQISSGSTHSLLMTKSGGVYSWGTNVHGQLGQQSVQEQAYFRRISKLRNKVTSIACGNEFSCALDITGQLWVWGRADSGQLGLDVSKCLQLASTDPSAFSGEFRGGTLARVFSPAVARKFLLHRKSASPPMTADDKKEEESIDNAIEMEWDLPDLKAVGLHNVPYNKEALVVAMTKLHGYYRNGPLLQCCYDCEDWETLSKFYEMDKQWPQALEFGFRSLPAGGDVMEYSTLTKRIFSNFFRETINFDTPESLHCATVLVKSAVVHWHKYELSYDILESMLTIHVPLIAKPIFDVLSSCSEGKRFSLKFQMLVAHHIMSKTKKGQSLVPGDAPRGSSPKVPSRSASVVGDKRESVSGRNVERMWTTLRHNLSKDLTKSPKSITISDQSVLTQFGEKSDVGGIVPFTCGHTYTTRQLLSVLGEFDNRMRKDLPHPNLTHSSALTDMYQKCSSYSAGCPVCVYQQVRKVKLQEVSNFPIKPWNID